MMSGSVIMTVSDKDGNIKQQSQSETDRYFSNNNDEKCNNEINTK